jgi:hypothetical protein
MITTMAEDSTSRKRLKKKVLDRWENEGGRLCDDPTKTPENRTQGTRERTGSKLSRETSAASNDNPPVETRRQNKK